MVQYFLFLILATVVASKQGFTIENNFISLNSYYCTELNAPSLILLLRIACDNGFQFLP